MAYAKYLEIVLKIKIIFTPCISRYHESNLDLILCFVNVRI